MLNISGLKEGIVIDHIQPGGAMKIYAVSYTHLRAHETGRYMNISISKKWTARLLSLKMPKAIKWAKKT